MLCGLHDKHSLYYIYTALNKDLNLPGIYEFTALGLLDDREIDYYNSKEQVKVPKQDWMKEKMQPDYWEKGTQSRKSKEQWFKVNVEIPMQRMRHTNDTTKPDVHAFAKKSTTDSGRLTLTCLATGFYPKDMKLYVRKLHTSLPEHLLTSSGVRPNEDGAYQSVEIQEDQTADYDCYVTHSSIKEPLITKWEGPPSQGGLGLAIGGLAGVIVLVLVGVVIFILNGRGSNKSSSENVSANFDASSNTGSRSSGSSCDSVENVNEASALLRSDADKGANDSLPDEKQELMPKTPAGQMIISL